MIGVVSAIDPFRDVTGHSYAAPGDSATGACSRLCVLTDDDAAAVAVRAAHAGMAAPGLLSTPRRLSVAGCEREGTARLCWLLVTVVTATLALPLPGRALLLCVQANHISPSWDRRGEHGAPHTSSTRPRTSIRCCLPLFDAHVAACDPPWSAAAVDRAGPPLPLAGP